jgi:dual specificity phosphatase 12
MTTPARPKIPAHLNIVHVLIEMEDDALTDLLGVLDGAVGFIDGALGRGSEDRSEAEEKEEWRVLVHCLQGISRSGAVVVAYIMRTLKLRYAKALEVVRKYRPIVTPNPGFAEQLVLWHEMGFSVFGEDGEEKKEYVEWKIRRDGLVEKGEEEVNREKAKSMAGLAARIGGMRRKAVEEEYTEAR